MLPIYMHAMLYYLISQHQTKEINEFISSIRLIRLTV